MVMWRKPFAITVAALTILGLASLPAQVVHTYAALDVQNNFTGSPNSFQAIVATAVSATSVTDSGLTNGDCVQASTGGLLATTASP